jgi:hypothetical protein
MKDLKQYFIDVDSLPHVDMHAMIIENEIASSAPTNLV